MPITTHRTRRLHSTKQGYFRHFGNGIIDHSYERGHCQEDADGGEDPAGRGGDEQEQRDSPGTGKERESVEGKPETKVENSRSGVTGRSSLYASDGANPLRTSWELKQEKRMKEKRMKELERSITEARIEAKRVRSLVWSDCVGKAQGDRGEKRETSSERDEVGEGPSGGGLLLHSPTRFPTPTS